MLVMESKLVTSTVTQKSSAEQLKFPPVIVKVVVWAFMEIPKQNNKQAMLVIILCIIIFFKKQKGSDRHRVYTAIREIAKWSK